jgi:biotin carboxyl carrier protein
VRKKLEETFGQFEEHHTPEPTGAGDEEQLVATLSDAIEQRRVVAIDYLKDGEETPAERLIEPYSFERVLPHWFIHSWDRSSGAERSFRLDRMRSATLLDERFERREGFDARALELAKDAALFVGPILELKHRLDAPVGGRIVEAVAPRGRRLAGTTWLTTGRLGAAAAALVAAVVLVWPTTYRVVATARVEGAVQRVMAAPSDGFVRAVSVRPGDTVRAGQVLLTLEDQELALERDKWGAEIAQLDKQYREALSKDDASQIVIARSKLEQAQTQLDLALRQLDRAQLKAPIDGVVISGDLSQAIGTPVKRGQELMTLAPDRRFRVVAEVDEQDVAALREGQPAQVMFAAFTERPLPFAVTRVSPVATTLDGRNVFEVEGRVDDAAAAGHGALRHGLRGVARIDVDQRSQGAIWWQRAGGWVQRTAWRLLG